MVNSCRPFLRCCSIGGEPYLSGKATGGKHLDRILKGQKRGEAGETVHLGEANGDLLGGSGTRSRPENSENSSTRNNIISTLQGGGNNGGCLQKRGAFWGLPRNHDLDFRERQQDQPDGLT